MESKIRKIIPENEKTRGTRNKFSSYLKSLNFILERKIMKRKIMYIFFLLLLIILASCSSLDKKTENLEGKWILREEKQDINNEVEEFFISFDTQNNKVYGKSGRNTFRGSYSLIKDKITFSTLASTRMASIDGEKENKFYENIEKTNKIKIKKGKLFFMNNRNVILIFDKSSE